MASNRFPFSVARALFQRNNPDNSIISPTRVLGFSGTIDVSGLGASQDVTIKIDDNAAETKSVSLSAVVDDEAATVAELVTALTAAAFTDVTFSSDATTGRLKMAYSGAGDPTYIQMYDDGADTLCAVMDIGQGFGAKIITKDNILSASAGANTKDREEIETEDGNGSITSVEIPAELKGLNPSVSLQADDPELKAMVLGGTYNATSDEYAFPSQDDEPPSFAMEVFQTMYSEGANKRRDFVNVKRTRYYSGTASISDMSAEAKSWSSTDISASFLDYSDPTASGAKIGPAKEKYLSVAEYNAIDWDTL